MIRVTALVIILLACHFSYQVDYFPQAWGDEQNNISFDYHYSTLGERVDLTWISECYNQRGLPKLPLPWTSWLRSLYHRLIECSSVSGRMFSVAMIVASLLLTAVVSPIRFGWAPCGVLILLMSGALSPSLYFAARTIRFEQEILLIGCLSLFLLPCFLRSRATHKINLIVWSVSGCLSGYAGASHPLGYVFPAVQLASLIFLAGAWEETDGLNFRKRILSWLAGFALTVAMQIGLYAYDWSNWIAYITDTSIRFLEVKKSLIAWWYPQWPYSMGLSEPWLAATLYAFKLAAVSPYMTHQGSWLLAGVFAFQSTFCLVTAFVWLIRRQQCFAKNLPAVLVIWSAAGFVIGHFAYAVLFSPNYTAYPYLALLVPTGFAWIVIQSTVWIRSRFPARGSIWGYLPLFVLSLAILLGLYFSIHQTRWVAKAYTRGELSSFDDHLEVMAQTGKKTGWLESDTSVYIDNYTWRAAGPHWKSLFEVSFNEKSLPAESSDRVSFSDALYNQVFKYPNWGQQTAPALRLERIQNLFQNRFLSALVFSEGDEFHFWEPARLVDEKCLLVGRVTGPGEVQWARTISSGLTLNAQQGKVTFELLSKGWHVLLIKGTTPGGNCLRVLTFAQDSANVPEERSICSGPIHQILPKALLVHVRQFPSRLVIEPGSPAVLPDSLQAKVMRLSDWSAD